MKPFIDILLICARINVEYYFVSHEDYGLIKAAVVVKNGPCFK